MIVGFGESFFFVDSFKEVKNIFLKNQIQLLFDRGNKIYIESIKNNDDEFVFYKFVCLGEYNGILLGDLGYFCK